MVARPRQPQSVWDLYEQVPHHLRSEVINGALHVEPRPAGDHALAATALTGELYSPFHRGRGGPGGWVILAEPELRLRDSAVSPDLAGWRKERAPNVRQATSFEVAPDWICEILSPSTEHRDRNEKMELYAAERVAWLWLLAPKVRVVEAYRLEGDGYEGIGRWSNGALARIAPFEAIEIDLSALWEA